MIPDEGPAASNPSAVKKLVFCSGKVYYDLKKARGERKLDETVAIARMEQVLYQGQEFTKTLYKINVFKKSIIIVYL